MTGPLAFALLVAIAVMIFLLVQDPDESDDEDEHATMHGPGLPHHRRRK